MGTAFGGRAVYGLAAAPVGPAPAPLAGFIGASTAEAWAYRPRIITRAQWGADEGLRKILAGARSIKQLIQKLVTGDPTPQYVYRVATAFNNNGQGVRGVMRAVVNAILTDPEARVMKENNNGYGPSYNAQFTTDAKKIVIVSVEVTQDGNDAAQLQPAMQRVEEEACQITHLGEIPEKDGDN